MTKPLLFRFTLLLFFLVPVSIYSQVLEMTHEDSLSSILEEYYDLNLKVFQAESKVKDIDNLFKLFTADFTYVHPKYGGVYSRQDLYDGYVRNQKNGGYDGSVVDIKVINKINGLNAIAVEKRFVRENEEGIKDGDLQMALFEFRHGKITRVFEYW